MPPLIPQMEYLVSAITLGFLRLYTIFPLKQKYPSTSDKSSGDNFIYK